MKYYIYRHIRLDTNTPFYVGKGKDNRAYRLDTRSDYHKRITNKYGCKIEILKEFFDEKEAFTFETILIKLYKSLGYCEANFTDGGEGLSGHTPWNKGKKLSKEICKKMSLGRKGKSSFLGKTHTTQTKLKISKSNSGRLETIEQIRTRMKIIGCYRPFKVYDKKTKNYIGIWEFAKHCANDLDLQTSNIIRCLNGERKSHKGYIFKEETLNV